MFEPNINDSAKIGEFNLLIQRPKDSATIRLSIELPGEKSANELAHEHLANLLDQLQENPEIVPEIVQRRGTISAVLTTHPTSHEIKIERIKELAFEMNKKIERYRGEPLPEAHLPRQWKYMAQKVDAKYKVEFGLKLPLKALVFPLNTRTQGQPEDEELLGITLSSNIPNNMIPPAHLRTQMHKTQEAIVKRLKMRGFYVVPERITNYLADNPNGIDDITMIPVSVVKGRMEKSQQEMADMLFELRDVMPVLLGSDQGHIGKGKMRRG